MAQIDLKNVTIKIKDGYNGGGSGWLVNRPLLGFLVNNVAGYMTSDATMLIDTGTVLIPTGAKFTVAGETASPVHTVTAHIETLGATTSVTFTPALASAVADDAALTFTTVYAPGTLTMLVDGGTVALAVGDTFSVAGDPATGLPTVHTISAHSETLSITTSITFTPGLGVNIADDSAITILPRSLSVKIGEGNLTYSEKRKIKYVTDRGLLDTVKEEDQQPVEVKLDYVWDYLASSTGGIPPTAEEAFKQIGNASGWISSAPDKCELYSVDIELINAPPCDGIKVEVINLPMFRWEDLAHDPKTSQVAVTGKCNVIRALVARV